MNRLAIALTALSLLLGGASTAQARGVAVVKACPGHVQGIYFYRHATRQWEHKMGMAPSKSNFNASKIHSCKYTVWVAHKWETRAVKLRRVYPKWLAAQIPAVDYDKWACIHHYEGAWNSNTGNGFYGGLQMDLAFQSLYGAEFLARWGTADKWPVWAQITAAERAYDGRGFSPWPNTARACGLL